MKTTSGGSVLRDVEHAFVRATRDRRLVAQLDCVFGGRRARIRVAGLALAGHLRRAFGHLDAGQPGDPTFVIDLWDEAETGVAAPAVDAGDDRRAASGDGRLRTAAGGRVVGQHLDHATLWLDREAQRLIGSVTSARDLSLSERGKPLQYLLSLWHNDRGVYVIHSGLVATGGTGVLLAGAGGSGKSTTALTCAAHGFDYLGDDCVALEQAGEGAWVGHSLFSAPWIALDHLERFPALADHVVRGTLPEEDKGLVLLDRARPASLARQTRIGAIALPKVVDRPATRVAPATKGAALLALAPSSIILFAPTPGARGLRQLAALVDAVPAFWLELGRDLSTIPPAIERLAAGGGTV